MESPSVTSDTAFADWIKDARTRAGVSQEELARRVRERGFDFQQQTIYKIEKGSRRVSIGEAVALADALDQNLALFAEKDPASRAALRLRIEQQAKEILTGMVEVESLVRRHRDAMMRLAADVEKFDELAGDELDDWWGKKSTAEAALLDLFSFDEADGMQWSWNQWAYSPGGHRLLKRFGLVPASELPIPGYDDEEEDG
ncbi:helix-turn-helix transcriptional regulator [Microbacterium arborescens]|uniref:helix-turn-helix transcriptional regulator n=1 Tax=Microbacterium arborescens TaxID=33883 RepID=UPI0027D76E1C|nr:helix-turn-helix transcriptional regulator [Microbacterium arborescens]